MVNHTKTFSSDVKSEFVKGNCTCGMAVVGLGSYELAEKALDWLHEQQPDPTPEELIVSRLDEIRSRVEKSIDYKFSFTESSGTNGAGDWAKVIGTGWRDIHNDEDFVRVTVESNLLAKETGDFLAHAREDVEFLLELLDSTVDRGRLEALVTRWEQYASLLDNTGLSAVWDKSERSTLSRVIREVRKVLDDSGPRNFD